MKIKIIILIDFLVLFPIFTVLAAGNTTGYAWSENGGWINFGCDGCSATVSSSTITGYAWCQNYGWINLAPTNSGVTNSSGTLSGYA